MTKRTANRIGALEAEGFALYTTLTAAAMVDPYTDEVRTGLRRLKVLKARIQRLEVG